MSIVDVLVRIVPKTDINTWGSTMGLNSSAESVLVLR